MTDPIHEQLSAFLDGELSAVESELLLKRIERAPELKDRLERYVLAGEALRATEVQARPSRDFGSRVAGKIAGETLEKSHRFASHWLKPIAGGAIAAGVAAVALVSFQGSPILASREAADSGDLTAQIAAQSGGPAAVTRIAATQGGDNATVPAAGLPSSGAQMALAVPVSDSNQSTSASYVVPPATAHTEPLFRVVNGGRLANYVVAHSEYSSALGRRNVLMGLMADESAGTQNFQVAHGPDGEIYLVEALPVDATSVPPAHAVEASEMTGSGSDGPMVSRSPR